MKIHKLVLLACVALCVVYLYACASDGHGVSQSGALKSGTAGIGLAAFVSFVLGPITGIVTGLVALLTGLFFSNSVVAGGAQESGGIGLAGWLVIAALVYYVATHKHGLAGLFRAAKWAVVWVQGKVRPTSPPAEVSP